VTSRLVRAARSRRWGAGSSRRWPRRRPWRHVRVAGMDQPAARGSLRVSNAGRRSRPAGGLSATHVAATQPRGLGRVRRGQAHPEHPAALRAVNGPVSGRRRVPLVTAPRARNAHDPIVPRRQGLLGRAGRQRRVNHVTHISHFRALLTSQHFTLTSGLHR
jgi:hypothetical protein